MTQEQKIWMGLRIRDVRRQRGLSGAELARAVGLSAQAFSSIERGSCPRLEVMVDIVETLDVSMDYIVRGIRPEQRRWGLVFHSDDELESLGETEKETNGEKAAESDRP